MQRLSAHQADVWLRNVRLHGPRLQKQRCLNNPDIPGGKRSCGTPEVKKAKWDERMLDRGAVQTRERTTGEKTDVFCMEARAVNTFSLTVLALRPVSSVASW